MAITRQRWITCRRCERKYEVSGSTKVSEDTQGRTLALLECGHWNRAPEGMKKATTKLLSPEVYQRLKKLLPA